MRRVMYKNSQLPIILATIARRKDLSDFEREVSKENRGFKGGVCVSVTRSQPNWTLGEMGDSGAVPETVFPPPSTKHQIMEFIMEEWCRLPPIEFQTLVESTRRCIEAVLARGDPTPYRDTLCWCFLYFSSYLDVCVCVFINCASPPFSFSVHHFVIIPELEGWKMLVGASSRWKGWTSPCLSRQSRSHPETQRRFS